MDHHWSQIGLPRAWTPTLLKQCRTILTEKRTKGRQNQKKSFECPTRNLENYSLRWNKAEKKLPKRAQAMLENKDGHTKYWLSDLLEMCKLFLPCLLHFHVCLQISINHCTFNIFLAKFAMTRTVCVIACNSFSQGYAFGIICMCVIMSANTIAWKVLSKFW